MKLLSSAISRVDAAGNKVGGHLRGVLVGVEGAEVGPLLQPLRVVGAEPDTDRLPGQILPGMDIGRVAGRHEEGVAVPECRRAEVDDLDPLRRDVNVAGKEIEAAALQPGDHRLPRSVDELVLVIPACSSARSTMSVFQPVRSPVSGSVKLTGKASISPRRRPSSRYFW